MRTDLTVVETTYTCPVCGSRLVLAEDGDNIWMGCDRCAKYVRVAKIAAKRFLTARQFMWRELTDSLYIGFLEEISK